MTQGAFLLQAHHSLFISAGFVLKVCGWYLHARLSVPKLSCDDCCTHERTPVLSMHQRPQVSCRQHVIDTVRWQALTLWGSGWLPRRAPAGSGGTLGC